jgi:hypothetical protein
MTALVPLRRERSHGGPVSPVRGEQVRESIVDQMSNRSFEDS